MEPSPAHVARVIDACAQSVPNHPLLESAEFAHAPHGFQRDALRVALGEGEAVWLAARAAIDTLAMYPPGWSRAYTSPGGPVVGAPFVSVIRHFGFYSVLPGRIRGVIDETGSELRYGFSFLTLEGHAERGVERFLITWDQSTDVVHYDLTAISRPVGVVRFGKPFARLLQRRFQRDSIANVRRVIAGT
jgi:uncharacterized protein (UPF0548 family)